MAFMAAHSCTSFLSIPSAGRTGMKHRAVCRAASEADATFNTLSGSYRDEAATSHALGRGK